MNKKFNIICMVPVFLIALLFLKTCNRNSTESYSEDKLWFIRITETTADNEIITEDPNDWGMVVIEDETDVKKDTTHYNTDSTAVEAPSPFKVSYGMQPAYPNPACNIPMIFNYALGKKSFVKVFILNTKLDTVNILVEEYQVAGYFRLQWNFRNINNERVPPGMYRCFLKLDEYTFSGDIQIKNNSVINDTEYRNFADSLWHYNKWFEYYDGFPEICTNWGYLFPDSTFVRDELFYEIIGKSNDFKIGWNDVPENLSDGDLRSFNSATRTEYLSLWNNAHND